MKCAAGVQGLAIHEGEQVAVIDFVGATGGKSNGRVIEDKYIASCTVLQHVPCSLMPGDNLSDKPVLYTLQLCSTVQCLAVE